MVRKRNRKRIKKLNLLLNTIKQIFDESESHFIDFSELLDSINDKSSLNKTFIENTIGDLIMNDFFFVVDEMVRIKGYNPNLKKIKD